MIKAGNMDRVMIVSTLLLVAMGLLMVHSTSDIIALNRYGDRYFFLRKQVIFSVAGLDLSLCGHEGFPIRSIENSHTLCLSLPCLSMSDLRAGHRAQRGRREEVDRAWLYELSAL